MKAQIIPLQNLIISFIPLLLVLGIFIKWKLKWKTLIYASARMLFQLLAIGYFLTFIFEQNHPLSTVAIAVFMMVVSSWIALSSIKDKRKQNLINSLLALFLGATPVLLLVTAFVIPSEFWYSPAFFIPLAGMAYSNGMNAIGIASERYESEIKSHPQLEASRNALSASLIPQINSFFAVGLVSLPGMMTGQILSGVDPLIAVRYQIVIMSMVMASGGLSAAFYLYRLK